MEAKKLSKKLANKITKKFFGTPLWTLTKISGFIVNIICRINVSPKPKNTT